MKKKMKVAVSILGATDVATQMNQVMDAGADWIHIDVMDGKFVQNEKFNRKDDIENLRRQCGGDAFFDCHMMVQDPFNWVDAMAEAGVNMFTFHYESTPNHRELIEKIHARGMKAGIALNYDTDVDNIEYVSDILDMVLVLTVNRPGIGGLQFIPDALEKCKKIKSRGELLVEVDGGINMSNVGLIHESRAVDVLVGGLVILNSENMKKTIEDMRGHH